MIEIERSFNVTEVKQIEYNIGMGDISARANGEDKSSCAPASARATRPSWRQPSSTVCSRSVNQAGTASPAICGHRRAWTSP